MTRLFEVDNTPQYAYLKLPIGETIAVNDPSIIAAGMGISIWEGLDTFWGNVKLPENTRACKYLVNAIERQEEVTVLYFAPSGYGMKWDAPITVNVQHRGPGIYQLLFRLPIEKNIQEFQLTPEERWAYMEVESNQKYKLDRENYFQSLKEENS